jgi:uncharacterized protein (TIGR00255 family)
MALESMTGFGRAEAKSGPHRVQAEARSVNHKSLEVRCRLPDQLAFVEPELRSLVRDAFSRGSLILTLSLQTEAGPGAGIDPQAAAALVGQLRSLATRLDLPGEVTLETLSRFPQILRGAATAPDDRTLGELALRAARGALRALAKSRRSEGAALTAVIRAHLGRLERQVAAMRREAGRLPRQIMAALEERLAALVSSPELNPARLEEEVAYLVTRRDFSEELERLQIHLGAMRKALTAGEPAGRKLEFLAQEILRELTTAASKAAGSTVAALSVSARVELEKIREQIYNVQ